MSLSRWAPLPTFSALGNEALSLAESGDQSLSSHLILFYSVCCGFLYLCAKGTWSKPSRLL